MLDIMVATVGVLGLHTVYQASGMYRKIMDDLHPSVVTL